MNFKTIREIRIMVDFLETMAEDMELPSADLLAIHKQLVAITGYEEVQNDAD